MTAYQYSLTEDLTTAAVVFTLILGGALLLEALHLLLCRYLAWYDRRWPTRADRIRRNRDAVRFLLGWTPLSAQPVEPTTSHVRILITGKPLTADDILWIQTRWENNHA